MNNPLISVIVPVYKVEPYLRRCLDSLVGQTYTNLEILLVDDGSPDRCGAICDEYAARDSRITVIHQKNGGVSAARNTGLDAAKGEWLGFVDSDDWIEPEMYAALLEAAVRTGADIAVCGKWLEYARRSKQVCWETEQLLTREEAMGQLLDDRQMQNSLWDKLVRRELFAGIRFPVGKRYEDLAVMYRVIEQASRVCCLPRPMYHYLQRQGSIMADASLDNRIEYHAAAYDRWVDMMPRWPQYRQQLLLSVARCSIGMWCSWLSASSEQRGQYRNRMGQLSEAARELDPDVLSASCIGRLGKIVIRLMRYPRWWSFVLTDLISCAHRVLHGRRL